MDHMNDQPYPGQIADSAASDRCVLIIDDDALNLKLFAMTQQMGRRSYADCAISESMTDRSWGPEKGLGR